jgi:multisubunit Na+/H+ antiporter MnhE subunit
MLHAAAMLIGLCLLWLLATQRWTSAEEFGAAVAISVACVLAAARFGGIGASFAMAPRLATLSFMRIGAVAAGALSTLRAAFAADVTLKPALVRIKTRAGAEAGRAAFASQLSATPGAAVVETDADGFLAHVLNEDAIDAADLGRLEARAAGGAS